MTPRVHVVDRARAAHRDHSRGRAHAAHATVRLAPLGATNTPGFSKTHRVGGPLAVSPAPSNDTDRAGAQSPANERVPGPDLAVAPVPLGHLQMGVPGGNGQRA